jgi:predicted nuclease of predicted toxin-antitoxin system
MALSYQEKSIWGTLATTLAVYGYYFATVFSGMQPSQIDRTALGRLISAVVVIVVLEVVYHILIAVSSKVERKDERDIHINNKAYRNAYFLLAADLFMLMATVALIGLTPFLTVNLMLLSVVVSEIVKSLTQLFYYRRGL